MHGAATPASGRTKSVRGRDAVRGRCASPLAPFIQPPKAAQEKRDLNSYSSLKFGMTHVLVAALLGRLLLTQNRDNRASPWVAWIVGIPRISLDDHN